MTILFTPLPLKLQSQVQCTVCINTNLPVFFLINIKSQSIDSQKQICAALVLDLKVVDTIHLQILGDLQILHHGIIPAEEIRIHAAINFYQTIS